MTECGGYPGTVRSGRPSLTPRELAAYLELHIEQGPVLEELKIPVGVVTGIRGNLRVPAARCIGEYSHCGGVPRSHRRDAAIAVAELVVGLDRIWDECEARGQDFAFTVGHDRKSVVSGKSVSVRVDLGGRRIIKKKKNIT